MKKLAAKQKRDPHLDWLYNHPDTKMKEAVQRGAVDYIIYNDIDVYAEAKRRGMFKTYPRTEVHPSDSVLQSLSHFTLCRCLTAHAGVVRFF